MQLQLLTVSIIPVLVHKNEMKRVDKTKKTTYNTIGRNTEHAFAMKLFIRMKIL